MHSSVLASKVLILIVCLGCPLRARSSGGVALWTNYFGPIAAAAAVAVDSEDNVVVTGLSLSQNFLFGEYLTIKYSSDGLPLWTNHYAGSIINQRNEPKAMGIDRGGNIFVTGTSGLPGQPGDYLTVGISGEGAPLWERFFNGGSTNGRDVASAIAVDSSGWVFVSGRSQTSVSTDIATIAYSPSGATLWTNLYNRWNTTDEGLAIGLDDHGTVFVAGGSVLPGGNGEALTTVAYSSSGVLLWDNVYQGPVNGEDNIHALAIGNNGNVFVTGHSTGSGTADDLTTLAYSNSGAAMWTNRYNGPVDGIDIGLAIAVDGRGNVFVTGRSEGTGSGFDYVTIAYSNAGVPLWTNRYNGPDNGNDAALSLALDNEGNVFVTGYSVGSGGTMTNFEYATLAYSNGGVPLWTNRFVYATNNAPRIGMLSVDGAGNVIVAGTTVQGSTINYLTIKYSSLIAPYLEVQKAGNDVVLSWTNAGFALQTTATLNGPFTNIPGATSPYTNIGSQPVRFFRLSRTIGAQ